MQSFLILTIGIVLLARCYALDCFDCDRNRCKDPGHCRFGKTTDVCGCCEACYKGVGEKCGGPWDVFGICANHLSCVKLPGQKNLDPVQVFNAVGTCLALPK